MSTSTTGIRPAWYADLGMSPPGKGVGHVQPAKAKAVAKVEPARVPSAPACQPSAERNLTRLCNERSERVILGAILRDGSRFDEAQGLVPGHFGLDSHREVFAAVQRLRKRDEGIDLETVCNELGKRLAGIGGWAYVASLDEGLPRNPQIVDHVRIVRKSAAARATYKAMEAARAALEAGDDSVQTIDLLTGQLESAREIAATDGDCGLRLLKGADIQDQDPPFILPDHIPDETLFGVIGPPGICKTTVAILSAADLSRGRTPYTGASCPQRNILVLSNEDPASRIRKMFLAAGGDPSRLFVENTDDGWLLNDRARLAKSIATHNIGFGIIDSLASHSGKADLNSHAETMEMLVPLRALAEKYHCAIAVIHHTNKGSSPDHLQRVSGSVGISAALRHTLHVAVDPDDPDLRLLLNGKSNLCPPSIPALRFKPFPVGWAGESSVTLQEIYEQPSTNSGDGSAVDRASEWLRGVLGQGSREQSEIMQLAKGEGISGATLRRAKTALKVVSRKASYGQGWFWWLRDTEPGSVQ